MSSLFNDRASRDLLPDQALGNMKAFCRTQMKTYSRRYNASIKIQRLFRRWNATGKRRRLQEHTYSIKAANLFDQGIALAPSDGVTGVPRVVGFYPVPTLVIKYRLVDENDEILSVNNRSLAGLTVQEAQRMVQYYKESLNTDGVPLTMRLRRDIRPTETYVVTFQHFQLPLGLVLVPNPKLAATNAPTASSPSLVAAARAAFSNAVKGRLGRRKTPVPARREPPPFATDHDAASPLAVGPLRPVAKGALELSQAVSVGDQLVWIEGHGTTLPHKFEANLGALLRKGDGGTDVVRKLVFRSARCRVTRLDCNVASDRRRDRLHREAAMVRRRRASSSSSTKPEDAAHPADATDRVEEVLTTTGLEVLKHPRSGRPEKRILFLRNGGAQLDVERPGERPGAIAWGGGGGGDRRRAGGEGGASPARPTRLMRLSKPKVVRFADVHMVLSGCETDVFKRTTMVMERRSTFGAGGGAPKPLRCFSLVTSGRTFDFELVARKDNVVGRDSVVEFLRHKLG